MEYIAIFDYCAQEDDELTLQVNDIITNVTKTNGGWWKGVLNGKHGFFPENFVKEWRNVEHSSAPKSSLSNLQNSDAAVENSMLNGIIPTTVFHRASFNQATDDKVKIVNLRQSDSVLREKKVRLDRARVVYSYAAENDDELSLAIGDTVTIFEKKIEDAGWWKGEVNGKVGVFPDNFVELLPAVHDGLNISPAIVANKLESPLDPTKVASLIKKNTFTVNNKPSVNKLSDTVVGKNSGDSKLIALTDDHKACVSKAVLPMGAVNRESERTVADSSVDVVQQPKRNGRPFLSRSKLHDGPALPQPPLPPKSPILHNVNFTARTHSSAALPMKGIRKFSEPALFPSSLRRFETNGEADHMPRHAYVGNANGESVWHASSDFAVQIRQELNQLQESVNQFQLLSDKKLKMIKAEIEEEKCAIQSQQDEVMRLKKIILLRLGEV